VRVDKGSFLLVKTILQHSVDELENSKFDLWVPDMDVRVLETTRIRKHREQEIVELLVYFPPNIWLTPL